MSELPYSRFAQADQRDDIRRFESEPGDRITSPWTGWLAFASVIMILMGLLHLVAGFVTLFQSHYYEINTARLAVDESWTTLAWTQIILGVLVVAAGVALFGGYLWARAIAVLFAVLTIVENFVQIASSPVWNLLLIALALVVIFAIIVHGRDARNAAV
jgi:vacuolar-type H+-ATPase subunit I/STV1